MLFGFKKEELAELHAINTGTEISQQPAMWKETYELIASRKNEIREFLDQYVKKGTRIIFTGAGSSDYVGDTIRNYVETCTGIRTEAIASTDIVANPEEVLKSREKTILVSFGRSGNSPESIGAYRLLQENLSDVVHVVITCNAEGDLARTAEQEEKNFILLLPKETNDKGFAMTSSFSCMMLAALLFFDIDHIEENRRYVSQIITQGEKIIQEQWTELKALSEREPGRVVYLGAGCFSGLVQELALKNMELTNGRIPTLQESVLGFRHGPKTFMDDDTEVIVLMSLNEYTNQYTEDLIKEIHGDQGEHTLIVYSSREDSRIQNMCDVMLTVDGGELPEIYAAFLYLLYGQIFALFNSVRLGIRADNPSPDGIVNRVVKGVILHEYGNEPVQAEGVRQL